MVDDPTTVATTVPADRRDVVRDLTADELHAWMPHVGTLASGVRAVWVDLLAGDEWEPVPDGVTKRCRAPKCEASGVVERRRTGKARKPTWWAYCPVHCAGEYLAGIPGTSQPSLLTRRIITPGGPS